MEVICADCGRRLSLAEAAWDPDSLTAYIHDLQVRIHKDMRNAGIAHRTEDDARLNRLGNRLMEEQAALDEAEAQKATAAQITAAAKIVAYWLEWGPKLQELVEAIQAGDVHPTRIEDAVGWLRGGCSD